eukprot:6477945-Karenia_brevis.AAC.1
MSLDAFATAGRRMPVLVGTGSQVVTAGQASLGFDAFATAGPALSVLFDADGTELARAELSTDFDVLMRMLHGE